jgi:hypothetical protein
MASTVGRLPVRSGTIAGLNMESRMMQFPRSVATVLTVIVVVAFSALRAQEGQNAAPPRRLDPDLFSVQLLLGVGDSEGRPWGGRVKVDHGEVVGVEGYRFHAKDVTTGRDAWQAKTHVVRKFAPKLAKGKATSTGTPGPIVAANGVIVMLKAPTDAVLSVTTDGGNFPLKLADLASGSPHSYLDGKVVAQRIATGAPLRNGPLQEDFPAAAADARGDAWVAYVVHRPYGPEFLESFHERPKNFADFAPKGGGDQVRLLHFADGRAADPIEVTAPELDIWRPAVAVAGDGAVVVAWSENQRGNWDIVRRRYDPPTKSWSEPKRVTTDPGADTDVVLATAPDGKIWMSWQAWRDGQADILLAEVDGTQEPTNISDHSANDWSPALAFDKNGRPFVAFDSYRSGNYDVFLWTGGPAGGRLTTLAATARFEARPTLAIDPRGRPWVAYEERDPGWGKDAENLVKGKGSTLYRSAAVKVCCVDGDRLLEAPDPVAGAPESVRAMNGYPRIAAARDGRIWLAFRHRLEAIWGGPAVMVVGGVWTEYATALAGKSWEAPQPLPRSDGLLDNRPALVTRADGPALVFYNSDGRLRREAEFNSDRNLRYWMHSGTPGGLDASFNEDLEVAALLPLSKDATVDPFAGPRLAEGAQPAPVHAGEPADVARMRAYRIQAGGKTYRLLRGDFHRHTELSMDGGSDGSLEDMWRYAIDAAALDWIGNNDHDNGGGKEYTWWLAQKTTDLYNSPRLAGLFSYERSNAYPHGHRNVMFARRGIRTLPRLVDKKGVVDDDTKMLYDYLKEHGGICASHSSATGMGTDWRDLNPEFEPMVEIYQGHRNSYEHLGAPRVARRENEALGAWKPLGIVWNALAMQYKVGFQASSDHISTHISYAVAIAEDLSRESIFDAFRRRHCYGATDNIVFDVRSGDHLMGDEFTADGPVRLDILVHGTRPIARLDIIKDFVYVYSTEPRRQGVQFRWQDDEKRPAGLSWYYVRAIQEDGEIAWGSPFWVHTQNSMQR